MESSTKLAKPAAERKGPGRRAPGRTPVTLSGLAIAVTLTAVACGGSSPHQADVTTSSSSTPAAGSTSSSSTSPTSTVTTTLPVTTTSTLPPTTTTSSTVVPTTRGVTTCQPVNLEVGFKEESAGVGHFGAIVVLTNNGSATCTLDGYIGLQMLNAANAPLTTNVTRGSGYLFTDPKPSLVSLAPGQAASAGVEWSAVPSPNDPAGGCSTSTALEITPPNDTAFTTISAAITACSLGALSTTAVEGGDAGPST